MYNAYKNIFDRVGLDYQIVTADTGVMGGLLSEEFQAITATGEDTLVLCSSCDFASNSEVCPTVSTFEEVKEERLEKELLHTPNIGVIDDLINCGEVAIGDAIFTSKYNYSSSNILIGTIKNFSSTKIFVKPSVNKYKINYVGVIND